MAEMNLKLLVVDDSLIARFTLVSQLRELGYSTIVEAKNGADALIRLRKAHSENTPFDLIITDLLMPEVSGIELLRKLSEEPDFKDIPKLITSVETERSTVLNSILAGADGYILKPSTTAVLKTKLEKVLSKPRLAV